MIYSHQGILDWINERWGQRFVLKRIINVSRVWGHDYYKVCTTLFKFPLSQIAFIKMASVQKFACAWKICPHANETTYNKTELKKILQMTNIKRSLIKRLFKFL